MIPKNIQLTMSINYDVLTKSVKGIK